MSHYPRGENLRRTAELAAYCRQRGIASEAEPGRIEGGEDGVADTAELEGVMTTREDVEAFIGTGIEILAPAFGNVHGNFGGEERCRACLDLGRLREVKEAVGGRVEMVMHGTNGVPEDLVREIVACGVTRVNVNKSVLREYYDYTERMTGKIPHTRLIEEGTQIIQKSVEKWMDVVGSSGKA